MIVSGISPSTRHQSFGVDLGNNVRSQLHTARCHAFLLGQDRVLKTEERTKNIENMHKNHVLTLYVENDSNKKDYYFYNMTPIGCNRTCSKRIAKLPINTPPLIIQAQLERALRKFKP